MRQDPLKAAERVWNEAIWQLKLDPLESWTRCRLRRLSTHPGPECYVIIAPESISPARLGTLAMHVQSGPVVWNRPSGPPLLSPDARRERKKKNRERTDNIPNNAAGVADCRRRDGMCETGKRIETHFSTFFASIRENSFHSLRCLGLKQQGVSRQGWLACAE